MKCECGNKLFYVQRINCCSDCDQNGAYHDGKYIYDLLIIDNEDLKRNQVEEDCECKMGTASGEGCHMYTCSECNKKENLHLVEGC